MTQDWLKDWKINLLPGLSLTGLVVAARLLGILHPVELKVLDLSLRWRPAEPTDTRITVITLTESDIQNELSYPISDQSLADLIATVQSYQPRVIGVDIFRDFPVGEGSEALQQAFTASNVIGINRIGGPEPNSQPISPPPMLPEAQIGFVDALLDNDGFLRRSLLAASDAEDNFRFSLTFRLAERYLDADGIDISNGVRDPETMQFGSVEIPRVYANTGGYIRQEYGGMQTLVNVRAGPKPFELVPYEAVVAGVEPALLQDRVVLVGYTATSVKDFISSGAIANYAPSMVPGVVFQAHAVSQILSAVYEGRSFLNVFPEAAEYLLIVGSGLLGLALVRWRQPPTLHLLGVVVLTASWAALSYGLILLGWWVPTVPVLAAFLLNAVALYPFYQAQSQLRLKIEEQEALIDSVFNNIHNGPLQTLARTIRSWPEGEPAPAEVKQDLHLLNAELRGIYDKMRHEIVLSDRQLVLSDRLSLDLSQPLHELLPEVYSITLDRYRSFFEHTVILPDFKPMADEALRPAQRGSLCRFLEEALINVSKYAKGANRVRVSCFCDGESNIIRVTDNGAGLSNTSPKLKGGFGTQQAQRLARSLRGQFQLTAADPQGVCCEIRWPVRRRWGRSGGSGRSSTSSTS